MKSFGIDDVQIFLNNFFILELHINKEKKIVFSSVASSILNKNPSYLSSNVASGVELGRTVSTIPSRKTVLKL